MKLKLSPEISYIIGLWSKRRTTEGLGIHGNKEIQQIFAQQVLEQKLTASNELLSDAEKIYFYHGKYRKFFQNIEREKLERYKYMNEYSANYVAGLFDAIGGITPDGIIYLNKLENSDELLFLRLGFSVRKFEGKLIIARPRTFISFIKNYTKLFANHPVMEVLKK